MRCVLALDCAGWACSAALWRAGAVVARRHEVLRRGQAERLMPMVEAVMAEGGLDYGDLDLVAVTRGPGGFTGVRIGLATARALALATGKPVVGIDNFAVVAAAVPPPLWRGRPLAVLIDAKRRELFAQLFSAPGEAAGPPCALAPERLAAFLPAGPALLAGDAVDQAAAALAAHPAERTVLDAYRYADAAVLARVAAELPLPPTDAPPPAPLYLRAPDVSRPREATP